RVERDRDRLAFRKHLRAPLGKRHVGPVFFETKSRLASARRDTLLVPRDSAQLLRCVRRTFPKQAVQQKDVEKAYGLLGDADGTEWVEIHEPDLDVLDAALSQGMQRTLSGTDDPLRPNRPVELVFDLQQTGRELPIIITVADADRLVQGIRLGERILQRRGVALQAVVAH